MRNQIEMARPHRACVRPPSTRPTSTTGTRSSGRPGPATSICSSSHPSGSTTRASAEQVLAAAGRLASGCSWSTRSTASATGATTSGPTTAGSGGARRLPTAPCRCSAARPRPTIGWWPTSQRQLGDDIVTIRGAAAPRAVCGSRSTPTCRPRPSGWPGSPRTCRDLPGTGIVYCLTVATSSSVAALAPRRSGIDGGGLQRGTSRCADEQRGARAALLGERAQVRRRHLGARHGLRQARRRRSSSTTRCRRARRSPTTSRSVGPAARSTRPTASCCGGTEDRDIQDWFIEQAFPPRRAGRGTCSGLSESRRAGRRRPLEAVVNVAPGGSRPMLKVLEVEGPSAASGAAGTARPPPWGTRGAGRAGDAVPRPEQAAMATYGATDRCLMQFLRPSSTIRPHRRAGAATTVPPRPRPSLSTRP